MPLAEKCHADNLRDLFRAQHPQAFDPSSSTRPPLSSELNILAKAREDCEDSKESELEDAEANAPQGWSGTGKPVLIGSGYVERRLCDGQGLCSPGAWAPGDRRYPSSQLWTSISRLFLATAESLSSVQLLSEVALGRHAKSPFSHSVVDQLRREVKVILAREGIQFERVEGDRTDMPIDFRLFGRPVESSSRSRSIDCNLRARGTSRSRIQSATLPKTLHEEEVADPGAERASRCR